MIHSLIKLSRPTQWLKNGVVFAALIFGSRISDLDSVILAMVAAAVFCLLSSSVYTLNDLFDRENDRAHPLKKERPIAAGLISPAIAGVWATLLAASALVGALAVNWHLMSVSLVFLVLNLLYSTILKKIVILDVMSISFSFVLRAYAGALAIGVPASKWMLINTMLLALFLGFGKRRHELTLLDRGAADHREILGRYSPYLLDQLIGVVTASVVVCYMLYSFSPEVSEKLGTENLFLTIPFVVYGVFRYLYLIHKEERGGSPTRVLIGDKPLLMNVLLWLATVTAILYQARL